MDDRNGLGQGVDRRQLEMFVSDLKRTYAEEKARAEELAIALRELQHTYYATVNSLSVAVEAKDEYTAGHLLRVTRYGLAMMRVIAPEVVAIDRQYEYGFMLHDIGKLGVPDSILRKQGPLTDDEWTIMRLHPEIGRRILAGIPFLTAASEIVFTHHERWDGKGYPRGLRGDEVPLGARVFAIADSFDAMTSDRPYRAAMPIDDAIEELHRNSGSQFWPGAIDAFVQMPREVMEETVGLRNPSPLPSS